MLLRGSSQFVWGLLGFLGLLGSLSGCGYQLVDERGVLGPERRSIRLLTLENRTTEPGFEALLADALREEFARRGALRPVLTAPPGGTAFELGGTIFATSVNPSAFSSVALTLEDSVEVSVSLAVNRAGTGGVVWEETNLRSVERFLASPDPQVYESNKEQALRRIASRLAAEVHDGLFQAFIFQPQPEGGS